MFEPASHNGFRKIVPSGDGAHYSVFHLDAGPTDKVDPEVGMQSLRALFFDGKANEMNFVLFSTSGVHGTYTTIEKIEEGLRKYGDDPIFDQSGDDWPEDFHGTTLTVLVVHPRIVCLRCGVVRVRLADIEWLKKLRASSWNAVTGIGSEG